jgi:hypothetical protein
LKRSCKNKSIHQLLGLIQLLKNEKNTQVILTQDIAGTGRALGLQIHSLVLANTSPSISCKAYSSAFRVR